ncbi:hypothetical protein BCR41DRAFT_371201 [Lobosporangium transversale]|uniref:Arrestin C-terminal-like domain-containing protein n=1 Tax=Lobosporangium transversale TaxID=64571 RepID=A0A1Y2GL81_9FUNG|nr:hypothetical protein BCR41DRAFT_371201 [Lobosporangium transversale]ORZ14372.1 hypothetical protein BCR41DRAFT_371201 [Lobosporangium transversale]|eukprot:XP_021880850.1 hypothetical protein BCR41DRAFT_371201 [Lobosporangium transversale]
MPPILPPPGSVPESSGGGSGFVSGIEAAAASALTLANSIAFRPTTTQPAKCSKLKIRIFFDSTIFQAGGNLFGRMEITATSSRSLKLGEIAVELAAYEEITSKDFTATQSFLSSRLCFQGPNIPPSNAVHGPCDEDGFWMAKKGKTTFPFAFQLPLDCPSSLVFGQTASLRYVVTGLVQVFYHGKDETIMKTKEAFVVEAWDGYNPDYKLPVQASNSTKLFWGGSGSLVLEAKLSEKLHSAGGNLNVEVKVKNNTSRKVQGIRLGVARRLEMVSNKAKAQQNPGLQIDTVSVSEVMGTQEFKSSSYLFDTGEERTTTLNMIVPGNARTIRGTALFEVTCFVVVSMLLGAFSGELSVEIPVKICHPASLTPAPKPKLDENHLPHHYNLVDEELDLDNNKPTRSSRRVGSNDSLASPTAGGRHAGSGTGRELPWTSDGTEKQDGYADSGRMGEWSQDARELSPANSITSIKSILSSPKQKLSKLADKIQRSTSPSSSSHLQHEHRQGSKHMDEQQGRRQLAKSPPLGPAMPIAYVPAVERVRYTPFQPPPTTKAKEFLKAAAQYQQEMAKNGALSRFEGDNVEFDLDDKKMASAIHQWITKKELDGMYGQMPEAQPIARSVSPIQIPAASPNRRRPDVDPINTQVGSFTSQYSPTGASPQSYDSPTAFGASSQFPPSPKAMPYTNQTTSRFLHHPHRQPAAPQTEAFGSAPEDCITDPPLFAKPLPLPSPPGAGSSLRAGATMATARARSLSPVPIPLQTPESLALAREAFERVKKIASPVQDHMVDTASLRKSAPQPEPVGPHTTSSVESNPNTRVPILVSVSSSRPNNPSGLSRLLSRSAESTDLPKDLQEGEATKDTPSTQPKSSAELRHIPMSRPLPIPVLNSQQPNIKAGSSSRNFEPRLSLESKMQSATSTSYGQSKHLQQPRGLSKSPPRFEPPTRSGHLPLKEHRKQDSISFVRQNAYVPKPTPVPKAKPPAPIQHSITSTQTGSTTGINAHNVKKINERSMIPGATQSSNSGFVYPKAARKPVSGTKPSVAAKPKALSIPSNHLNQETGKSLSHVPISVATAMMSPEDHANVDQHHPQNHPNEARATDDGVHELERPLAPAPSVRAPQVIPVLESEIATAASPRDLTSAIEEADEDNKDTNQIDQLTSAESQQQMHNDIRAQAIAAKYSIRATGAHTGGYMLWMTEMANL